MGCHCLLLIHVAEEQKLTQHPKAIIHQWKKKRIFKLPFSLLSFEKESKLMLPNQSYLQLFCFFNNIFPNGIFGVSQVREKERRRKRKRERERVRGRGLGFKFTEFIVVRGGVLSKNLMKRRKGPWR